MNARTLFAFLLSFLFLTATHAQVAAPIEISGKSGIDLKISDFSGPGADQAVAFLRNDLRLLSLFNLDPAVETTAVRGSVSAGGITATLTSNGSALFSNRSFEGDPRAAARKLADAISEALLNLPGIFSSRVVFMSNRTGNKEVYTMDVDGGNIRQITKDGVLALTPRFSYGGGLIAFTSYFSGWPQIWLIDLAAGKKKALTKFPGLNTQAAFSPNGSQLALILSKDGNPELYTMPVAGGEPTRLTNTRGTEASPCYSPQGNLIAYVSDDRGMPQIYTISPSGGTPQRVRSDVNYATDPDISPDGKKVAFVVRSAGQFQIAYTDLGTGQTDILTSDGGNEVPSWTKNSRHIIYAKRGSLYILDSLSKKSQKIDNGITGCSEPNCSK